jgi:hypothetical protein
MLHKVFTLNLEDFINLQVDNRQLQANDILQSISRNFQIDWQTKLLGYPIKGETCRCNTSIKSNDNRKECKREWNINYNLKLSTVIFAGNWHTFYPISRDWRSKMWQETRKWPVKIWLISLSIFYSDFWITRMSIVDQFYTSFNRSRNFHFHPSDKYKLN